MKEKSNKYEHLTEGEMLRIYEMRGAGKSFREIGDWLDRSESTVWTCVKWYPEEPSAWYRMSNVARAEYQYRSRKKRERRPRAKKLVKVSKAHRGGSVALSSIRSSCPKRSRTCANPNIGVAITPTGIVIARSNKV